MSNPKTLDIILPCYNPRSGWESALSESISNIKILLGENVIQSVIIVNDGSVSGVTEDAVSILVSYHPEVKLIEYPNNQGKGYAVRTGVRSSDADLQIYTDIDVPYVEESIKEFYRILKSDEADVVVASRGDTYYDSLSGFRRILSKSLRWLNGFLFGLKIKDTQGGLKGFNEKGKAVFLRTSVNRYLFDLQFIQMASKENLRLKALDVKLKPDIILPSPSPMILLKELHNFISLLFSR
ncbi:MAG: glycosyltransferase family 2 protein [Flavobacteriales bacterium]|nr:glycosyltransferase family 2 protein [Flavobacteriales bacterium]